MNQHEFKEWLSHHQRYFPAIGDWLARKDQQAKSRPGDKGSPTAQGILSGWLRILDDVALVDANAASDLMAKGNIEAPSGFSDHPRLIRQACQEKSAPIKAEQKRRTLIDGQETYACGLCLDTGFITVWHAQSVKAMAEGTLFNRTHNPDGVLPAMSAAAACTCQAGYPRRATMAVKCDAMPLFSPYDDGYLELQEFVIGAVERRAKASAWDPDSHEYPG